MNFRFSTLDGAYQTHPQNPYQTQGGPQQQPQQQQQQSNPAQSLQNSAPSTQPRLTPMAPPTAPPTPPTQQQQPQGQQTPYAVSQGGAQVQRSASQYQRTATPNVRRPQVKSDNFQPFFLKSNFALPFSNRSNIFIHSHFLHTIHSSFQAIILGKQFQFPLSPIIHNKSFLQFNNSTISQLRIISK